MYKVIEGKVFTVVMKESTARGVWKGPDQGVKVVHRTWPGVSWVMIVLETGSGGGGLREGLRETERGRGRMEGMTKKESREHMA